MMNRNKQKVYPSAILCDFLILTWDIPLNILTPKTVCYEKLSDSSFLPKGYFVYHFVNVYNNTH